MRVFRRVGPENCWQFIFGLGFFGLFLFMGLAILVGPFTVTSASGETHPITLPERWIFSIPIILTTGSVVAYSIATWRNEKIVITEEGDVIHTSPLGKETLVKQSSLPNCSVTVQRQWGKDGSRLMDFSYNFADGDSGFRIWPKSENVKDLLQYLMRHGCKMPSSLVVEFDLATKEREEEIAASRSQDGDYFDFNSINPS